MIRIGKTHWVNLERVTETVVYNGKLVITFGYDENGVDVDEEYLPDACRALNLPLPDVLGQIERQKQERVSDGLGSASVNYPNPT